MAITDIFSRRYQGTNFIEAWSKTESGFMVQAMTMMRNLLWAGQDYATVPDSTEAIYRTIHDKVALELGTEHLSQPTYQIAHSVYRYKHPTVVRAFLVASPQQADDPDEFFKDRISLIEQAFKHQYDAVQASNAALSGELLKAGIRDATSGRSILSKAPPPPRSLASISSGQPASKAMERLEGIAKKQASSYFQDFIKATNTTLNVKWDAAVNELNERLRINGYSLHFHNGLFQMTGDELIEDEIHDWFWCLVSDPIWKSVDEQMKEAFDRRDNGDRTSPFHAVSALESVIKIISTVRNANTGKENGAANYIDNLISERSGRFIDVWEGDMLKTMFRDVRNPFGHGPGENDIPKLSQQQNDWAIDTAMAWSKSLIERL